MDMIMSPVEPLIYNTAYQARIPVVEDLETGLFNKKLLWRTAAV